VLSFFHRFAPAAIASDLQAAFQIHSAALGGLAATYFYVYTLMQIPTGILADTLGPRRIVAAGGVMAGVGSLLFGLADSFSLATIGRLLVGLGVSVTFIALLKLNAAWFNERHFGTLTGLTILLGNLGAVLAASPLAWALGYVSWRDMFVVVGLFSLLLAGLAWWLVRDNPAHVGLPSLREMDGKSRIRRMTGIGTTAFAGRRQSRHLARLLRQHRRVRHLVRLRRTLGGAFPDSRPWLGPHQATAHTSILLAAFAVGAFFIGTLSDRLGRRKPVVIVACGLYLVCWLPLLLGWELRPGWSHACSADGPRRRRLHADLGLRQGSQSACAVRHGDQPGQYRRFPRRGHPATAGRLGDRPRGGRRRPEPGIGALPGRHRVLFGFALFGWLASFHVARDELSLRHRYCLSRNFAAQFRTPACKRSNAASSSSAWPLTPRSIS
jgi:MFS family permease